MSKRVDVHKGDIVKIISGEVNKPLPRGQSERDRFKNDGRRVLAVFPGQGRILVEGARLAKKNVRPNPQKQIKGGIAEQEARIHISNVMVICPSCNQPGRVARERKGDRMVRVCRHCRGPLDKENR